MYACLGSLAVKRVLGKDETAGSIPALGSLWLLRPVVTGFFVGERMSTAQERVPGVKYGTPTPYSGLDEKTGILHYTFKDCHANDLDLVQRIEL